eukprot:15068545-Ditylum_brightwellii.AAC.1
MKSDTHCPEKAEKVDKILSDASLAHLSRLRRGILEETSITKYGITVNCSSDKDIINKKVHETCKEIKQLIREAAAKREESNKVMAEIYSLTGKTTAEKALKSIINTEQMKKVWTKVGRADKKKEMGSISLLQVPITWPD